MTRISKNKNFRFTPQVLLRLIIFTAVLYLSISYLSNQNPVTLPSQSVLGLSDIYQKLPPNSRSTLENLSTSPQVAIINEKIEYLKSQTNGFPQKQITQIQKTIVETVLKNYLNNLDTN